MVFLDSYTDAFQACLNNKRFSIAHLHEMSKNMYIDSQGCYKIFFLLSGNKAFHIDGQVHDCAAGDVFLITPQEWHYFSGYSDDEDHERFVCFIYPTFLRDCCTDDTDLSYCFTQAHTQNSHKLSLSAPEQERLARYFRKLDASGDFGQDILDRSVFLELLVYLNRTYMEHAQQIQRVDAYPSRIPTQIHEIITYINRNLCEDLSTNTLAERCYMSPAYLCKLFRNATGTTLHKYVAAKRITMAKNLLSEGMSVSATCSACGFNDYSNFIKIFTKSVGISPKKYATLQKE